MFGCREECSNTSPVTNQQRLDAQSGWELLENVLEYYFVTFSC